MLKALLRFFKKKFKNKRRNNRRLRRRVDRRRRMKIRPKRRLHAHRRKKTARPRVKKKRRLWRARRPASERSKRAAGSRSKGAALGAALSGEVTHYFPKVRAAVVKCSKSISIGDPIRIQGNTTDFRQTVGSLQIDRVPIAKAKAGQEVGLEVGRDVKPGDRVFVLKG